MELRISLHETITKCTQALRALNLPAGLDTENGKNIGWLENRGLPGLNYLYKEIIHSDRASHRRKLKINIKGNTVNFSDPHLSGFFIAQSAVDLAENGKIVKNGNF